jgi:hypothetical protein
MNSQSLSNIQKYLEKYSVPKHRGGTNLEIFVRLCESTGEVIVNLYDSNSKVMLIL